MIDEVEMLTGVPFVAAKPKPEPIFGSLEGIGEWIVTVGSIFDKGMEVYDSFEGRRRANKIIISEQVQKTVSEPIPPSTYAKATALAVAQEFKKPLVIGAVLFTVVALIYIYKR